MPAITLTLTNAGRALLPANGGISAVQLTQVGLTATAVVPNTGLVALAGEFKRLNTLSGAVTGPDTVSLGILDETTDIYDARAFGLYTSTGTLFAVYGQAAPFVEKAAESNVAMTIDIKFADVSAAELVFGDANFVIPAATPTIQGVIEIATDEEVAAKTDAVRAVTPKGLWFAFSAWVAAAFSDVWRSTNDGSGSGLDADLLDGLQGSAYVRRDGTANPAGSNSIIVAGSSPTHLVDSAAVQIREVNYVAAAQSAMTYAPTLAFHWLGRAASSIKIDVNGDFRFLNNDASGTSFRAIAAAGYTANGNTVWHAGNDGAGSGLDADMLDGLHWTAFVRRDGSSNGALSRGIVVAGHSAVNEYLAAPIELREVDYVNNAQSSPAYSPSLSFHWAGIGAGSLRFYSDNSFRFRDASNNPNAYLAVWAHSFYSNGNVVWSSGNDGAGSGLDADLLDGQQGSYYTNITARLGYTPANKAGDTFTGAILAPQVWFPGAFTDTPLLYQSAAGTLTARVGPASGYSYVDFGPAGVKLNGSAHWHPSNDGSGSGLDADLLDGQDSGYYTNITARLGYTPANNTSVWRSDNDGAGSGLDADLLDGQDSGYYTNITARLGYTPANKAGDTFTGAIRAPGIYAAGVSADPPFLYESSAGVLTARIGAAGGYVYINYSTSGIGYNGNSVWHAGNDGSGSGLDADMLDGKHASDFVALSGFTAAGTGASGWRRAPDGFTEQWMQIYCNADEHASQNWPRAFSSIMDVQATPLLSTDNYDDGAAIKAFDTNSVTVIRTAPTGNRENGNIRVRACGYTATPTP